MTEFFDVGQFHKNDQTGKWSYQPLGYAKRDKDGTGFDITLRALPIPGPYGIKVSLKPSKPRDGQPQGGGGAPAGGMDDSEIPFAPEWR